MNQRSRFKIHFGWLLAGIFASIVVLVSLVSGSIYNWLDLRVIDRDSEPVWFWFLFVGHIIIAVGGFRVALTWGNPKFRQAYEDKNLRHREYMESQGRVSGRNILHLLVIGLSVGLLVWLGLRIL